MTKKLKDNDYYRTPPELWGPLLEWLGINQFLLDPCASQVRTALSVPAYYQLTETMNGLAMSWTSYMDSPGPQHVFLNPPYSDYQPWVAKAIACAREGLFVWALLNQSNANFWHDVINPHMQIKIALRQRVKFYIEDIQMNSPSYDNYLVNFGPDGRYLSKAMTDFPLDGEIIHRVTRILKHVGKQPKASRKRNSVIT